MAEETTQEQEVRKVTCREAAILPGNDVAPNLVVGQEYTVLQEYICKCGQIHYNVGVTPVVHTVTCYLCREVLPQSGKIHWANSTRFE